MPMQHQQALRVYLQHTQQYVSHLETHWSTARTRSRGVVLARWSTHSASQAAIPNFATDNEDPGQVQAASGRTASACDVVLTGPAVVCVDCVATALIWLPSSRLRMRMAQS
jgi:hypothetical protein